MAAGAPTSGATRSAGAALRGVGLERYIVQRNDRGTIRCASHGRTYEQPAAKPGAATAPDCTRFTLGHGVLNRQALDRHLAAEHRQPAVFTGAVQHKAGTIDGDVHPWGGHKRVDAGRSDFGDGPGERDGIIAGRRCHIDRPDRGIELDWRRNREFFRSGHLAPPLAVTGLPGSAGRECPRCARMANYRGTG